MIQNCQNITNPSGSSHEEQLVAKRLTLFSIHCHDNQKALLLGAAAANFALSRPAYPAISTLTHLKFPEQCLLLLSKQGPNGKYRGKLSWAINQSS